MRSKIIGAALVSFIIIAAAIFAYTYDFNNEVIEEKEESDDETPIITGNITSYSDAVNVFGLNLFRQLYDDAANDKNIFFSPYSIFVALAMTYEGAEGKTADEMAMVLNILQDNESFHQYMLSLHEYFNQNDQYTISTANALWVAENLHLLQEYLNVILSFYGGLATEVDFSDPQAAADLINGWIENNTNGLIKDLIKPEYILPLTALILTNAVYFKGLWKVQFDPKNTTSREFEDGQGNILNVPSMSLVDTECMFNYTETEDLQILELPYSGDEIAMVLMLPKETTDLSDVISSIDNNNLTTWIDEMYKTPVDVYLPKFTVETDTYDLNKYLIDLGMPTAFTPSADFSGITGKPELYISKVVHKAFIEVNEEGTEAAAATAVIMLRTSVNGGESHIVFDADHPFLYLLVHKTTGTVLFMGNIDNPTI